VLNRVREGKGTFGYNAASSEYGDMIELGILDPTKVTRLALQNAGSVAGLLLTTEVMIAESPKDDEHAHGAPAAAWVAWAEWTCNHPQGYVSKRAGPMARSFFVRPQDALPRLISLARIVAA